jgi:thiamine kinase-like enzyme
MPGDLIVPLFPIPSQPNAEWLTSVLQKSGVLSRGTVINVDIASSDAFNSSLCYLRLRYSKDSPLTAPGKLVLKRNIQDAWAVQAGKDEVRFYQRVKELDDHPLVVPQPVAVEIDPVDSSSFILFEDLSGSHAPPVTRDEQINLVRAVPRPEHQVAVIDALAQLHRYWWEHLLMSGSQFDTGYWTRDAHRWSLYIDRRRAAWARLIEANRGWFPGRLIEFYERLFDLLPGYWETILAPRFQSLAKITLIHGDAYFANFLCPKVPGSAPTYLIDWQSPSFDLPGYDLVNLLATFWSRHQRKEEGRELKLLRRYLSSLHEGGLIDFTWDDLVLDYQSGLIFWVLMPVQDGGDGASIDYWWPKMKCLIDAFDDWECTQLLQSCNKSPAN